MTYYTHEQLGPKRRLTPEGYLLCLDVAVARTGMMLYGPHETPVPPGPDGMTRIMREPEEVFAPDSIASLVGKPVTDDHPDEDVGPANWRSLARGFVVSARRGEGILDDLLLADVMITDPDTIDAVNGGKREVSCGYNPAYDADDAMPGVGRQRNIRYNHLALVERGRCGPRCSIGDRAHKEALMARTNNEKPGWVSMRDRIMGAFGARDEKALAKALDDAEEANKPAKAKDKKDNGDDDDENGDAPTHHIEIHNHHESADDAAPPWFKKHADSVDARFRAVDQAIKVLVKDKATKDEPDDKDEKKDKAEDEKILGLLEMEAPPGTSDKAKGAKDSAYLADSFQETLAAAEVMVPGMRVPTFDRAADPKKQVKSICDFRRQVLDLAYVRPEMRPIVDDVLAGRTLDRSMTCDAVRTVFFAAAALRRRSNNHDLTRPTTLDDRRAGGGLGVKGKVRTIAELNALNAQTYAGAK